GTTRVSLLPWPLAPLPCLCPPGLTTVPPSVPGPCEPEDLIDGIIFAANYLGSTQLLSERNPSKNIRMMQAQEAVSRVKRMQKAAKIKKKANSEGDAQTLTEVDLFISTQRIKVLNADTQVSFGRRRFKILRRSSQESQVELQTPSAGVRRRPRDSPPGPCCET
ncbi:hypothetical protein J1605_002224, partial [Eschrichtius robustus]